MAEMLLINPRRRRKARKAASTTTRRRRVASRRRRNPLTVAPMRRRINPIARARRRVMSRRRRNPIGGRMGYGTIMSAIREAFVGGAGSVAVDLAMGQINKFLPATLKTTPGTIGAGDAVKALITVTLGHLLARPTRGLSRKMAQGALTVQAANLMKGFVPATMTMGYSVPGLVTQGSARVSPNMGMGAYTKGTPLLSAYMKPNTTALLSGGVGRRNAASRENVYAFR